MKVLLFTAILAILSMFCFISCTKSSEGTSGNTPPPTVPKVVANFTISSTDVTTPATVTFTNQSTNALTYSWDFGDNTATSPLAAPSHIYNNAGTYLIILTATGSDGSKSSYSYPITIKQGTSLNVSVLDINGLAVSGATVSLYSSYLDYFNKTNVISTETTNSNGLVTFNKLSTIVYYYYVSTGCKNNFNSTYYTPTALLSGSSPTISTRVNGVGKVIVSNYSSDTYEVFLNTTSFGNLLSAQSLTISNYPIGSYTLKVVQKTGYIGYPTTKTYTVNVTCGAQVNYNIQ